MSPDILIDVKRFLTNCSVCLINHFGVVECHVNFSGDIHQTGGQVERQPARAAGTFGLFPTPPVPSPIIIQVARGLGVLLVENSASGLLICSDSVE